MSEQPKRAHLIRRLRFQVQKKDEYNSKIMNGGLPNEPNPFPAMELCGEAAEYLASLDTSAPKSILDAPNALEIIDALDRDGLDAAAPSEAELKATRETDQEMDRIDGTREPRNEPNLTLFNSNPFRGTSPPVPQEGVSEWSCDEIEEAATWVEEELKDIPNTHAIAGIVSMLRRIAPLLEKNARLCSQADGCLQVCNFLELKLVAAEARVKELEALLTIELKSKRKTPSPSP